MLRKTTFLLITGLAAGLAVPAGLSVYHTKPAGPPKPLQHAKGPAFQNRREPTGAQQQVARRPAPDQPKPEPEAELSPQQTLPPATEDQREPKASPQPGRHRVTRRRKAGLKGSAAELVSSGPKVGDLAPEFTLKTVDGESTVELSSFRGKQPVVLIFGSYT